MTKVMSAEHEKINLNAKKQQYLFHSPHSALPPTSDDDADGIKVTLL